MTAVRPSIHPNRIICLPLDAFKQSRELRTLTKQWGKFKFDYFMTRIIGILQNDKHIFKTKPLFRKEYVYKIQERHFYNQWFLFENFSLLRDYEKKYGGDRHETHDNIIRRMRFASWLDRL
jgi:hypothetical protein